MDIIKKYPLFEAEDILPYLTKKDIEFYHGKRLELANICMTCIEKLVGEGNIGIVILTNIQYSEINPESNMIKADVVFNFRDKNGEKLSFLHLNDGSKILTPDYFNLMNILGIHPKQLDATVDVLLIPFSIKREFFRQDYLFKQINL